MSDRDRDRIRDHRSDRDRDRDRGGSLKDKDKDRDRDRERRREKADRRDRSKRSRTPDRSKRSRTPDRSKRSSTPDRTRSRHRHSTRSPDRHRHSTRSPDPPRKRHKPDEENDQKRPSKLKAPSDPVPNNEALNGDDVVMMGEDGEAEMMKMMGIPTGFDTTKGKHVPDADVSGIRAVTKRQPRQYMNRRGGFNRPLPAETNR